MAKSLLLAIATATTASTVLGRGPRPRAGRGAQSAEHVAERCACHGAIGVQARRSRTQIGLTPRFRPTPLSRQRAHRHARREQTYRHAAHGASTRNLISTRSLAASRFQIRGQQRAMGKAVARPSEVGAKAQRFPRRSVARVGAANEQGKARSGGQSAQCRCPAWMQARVPELCQSWEGPPPPLGSRR